MGRRHDGARASILEALLERLGRTVVVVTSRGRVLLATAGAERIFGTGDALVHDRSGHICAAFAEDGLTLARAIRQAHSADPAPGRMRVRRRGGEPPLTVEAIAFDWVDGTDRCVRAVALLISESAAQNAARIAPLRDRFGITAAEARVAALLLDGRRVPEIAAALRVQDNTVRAHLKSIFRKTGATSQVSLLALLANTCPTG